MIRSFFIDFILPLLLFLIVRSVLGGLFKQNRQQVATQNRVPQPAGSMELKKDPVCGTYVSSATALSRPYQGHTVYFCSKECRDKFAG